MKMRLWSTLILLFSFSVTSFSQSQKKDTASVLKILSGFGEHTIRNNQRISFKLSNSSYRFSGTIIRMEPDTLYLKGGAQIPLHRIKEIGYFGRQEKIIRRSAYVMSFISGLLIYRYATKQDNSIMPLITVPAMTVFLFTYPKRVFKIPYPYTLQVAQPSKSPFSR